MRAQRSACGCRHGLPILAAWLFLVARACQASGGPLEDPLGTLIAVALNLPALLLGIGLHEFSHAWVATKLGDSTPQDEGRLSLNPLDHLEPVGSLLILIAYAWHLPLLGWGLPVRVTGASFRNPIRDMLKVGIAGPLMNLAIAGTGAAACLAFDSVGYGLSWGLPEHAASRLETLLLSIVMTNLSLAVFNLLPIPPLDGCWVAREFLDADQTLLLARMEPFGFPILFVLLQTPVLTVPFHYVMMLGEALVRSWALLAIFLAATALCWWQLVRSLPSFRFHDGGEH